jgi:hypothetical protein
MQGGYPATSAHQVTTADASRLQTTPVATEGLPRRRCCSAVPRPAGRDASTLLELARQRASAQMAAGSQPREERRTGCCGGADRSYPALAATADSRPATSATGTSHQLAESGAGTSGSVCT